MDPDKMDAVLGQARVSIEDAERGHGHLTYDHCRALAILMEEVGEAAADILEIGRQLDGSPAQRGARTMAIAELGQVAAVALLLIANLQEEL